MRKKTTIKGKGYTAKSSFVVKNPTPEEIERLEQKNRAINYIQKSIDVRRATRDKEQAIDQLDVALGLTGDAQRRATIISMTVVLARLDEVLQVLLRSP